MCVCVSMFVVVISSLRCVWLFAIQCVVAFQASLFFTISPSLLKLMVIELVMLSNYLILCHPLLLLHSVFPSFSVFPMSGLVLSGSQSTVECYSTIERSWNFAIYSNMINLEGIMLSKMVRKRQMLYDITYM